MNMRPIVSQNNIGLVRCQAVPSMLSHSVAYYCFFSYFYFSYHIFYGDEVFASRVHAHS